MFGLLRFFDWQVPEAMPARAENFAPLTTARLNAWRTVIIARRQTRENWTKKIPTVQATE